MEKLTLLARLKLWIASLSFRLFIWGNDTTPDEYWSEIYDQEYARRHKVNAIKIVDTRLRAFLDINGNLLSKSPLLDITTRAVDFPNDARRSGRTSILISRCIHELLYNGETVITDHLYNHGNHTIDYYQKYIVPSVVKALSGLLNLETREVRDAFKMRLITNEYGALIGLYILSMFHKKTKRGI